MGTLVQVRNPLLSNKMIGSVEMLIKGERMATPAELSAKVMPWRMLSTMQDVRAKKKYRVVNRVKVILLYYVKFRKRRLTNRKQHALRASPLQMTKNASPAADPPGSACPHDHLP